MLRNYIFEAIDIYCTVKRKLHPVRLSQIENLKSFCQADKLATDESIRKCVVLLLQQIKQENASRWSMFRRPTSSLAGLLQSALDSFDRQIVPINDTRQAQSHISVPAWTAPLMAIE
jgi:hypothetical protein